MSIRDVTIATIRPEDQRYKTVGDWGISGDRLVIYVSDTGNWNWNMCVAIHELVEAVLATFRGITPKEVDKFDFAHQDDEDPGSLIDCPIYHEHMIAMGVEMTVAQQMNIPWREYEERLEEISDLAPEGKLE